MNAFILIKVLVVSVTFLAKILFYFISTKNLPNKTDCSEKSILSWFSAFPVSYVVLWLFDFHKPCGNIHRKLFLLITWTISGKRLYLQM